MFRRINVALSLYSKTSSTTGSVPRCKHKMPLQLFEAIFDRASATYAAGETVTGKIALSIDRPKVARGMHVEVKGEGRINWISGAKQNSRGDPRSEKYLNLNFDILGTQTPNSRTEITAGYHEYRFSYQLPKNIPNTFKDTIGSVTYTMKVVIDRPWKYNYVHESTFTVICPLNLTDYSEQCVPIDEDNRVNFYRFGCFCYQGALNLDIKVPTTGYIPGQTIYTTINYENTSRSVEMTRIKAQLKQEVVYRTYFLRRKVQRMEYLVKSTKLYAPFPKKGKVVLDLSISCTPPSYMHHCKSIDVRYKLDLTINIGGPYFSIVKSYPIIIGTMDVSQMTDLASLTFPMLVNGTLLSYHTGQSSFETSNDHYTFEPSTHHDCDPSNDQDCDASCDADCGASCDADCGDSAFD